MAYAMVVSLALLLLWLIWTRGLKQKTTHPIFWVLAAAIVIGPWVEELWIAYNFDRLCRKDAGVFAHKTVEVAGFYDDRSAWGPRQLSESQYHFVESKDVQRARLLRVERADDATRNRVLAWYSKTNPGEERPNDRFIVRRLSDTERIAVAPNAGSAYRVIIINKPSARYHYKTVDNHNLVAHRISRFEDVVLDSESGILLGRYTNYTRGPYSFFIHLDAPVMECREIRGKDPRVYIHVLKPAK